MDSTRSVLAMQLASVLLGLTAFMALDATVLVANLIFVGIVLLGVLLIAAFESRAGSAVE